MLKLLLACFLICTNLFADCRNSENNGCHPLPCTRCSEPSDNKSEGEVRIMSRFTEPQRLSPKSDEYRCIPCSCGNGETDEEEECEDGNNLNDDGCSAHCKEEFCGDGIEQKSEECDEGKLFNGLQGSGCTADCKDNLCLADPVFIKTLCGNNRIDCDEQCDLGDENGKPNKGCDDNCIIVPICGDGKREGAEKCDDGGLNGQPESNCTTTCEFTTPPICGDGIRHLLSEDCDDGIDNGKPGKCAIDCKNSIIPGVCGNSIKETGETCDDGRNDHLIDQTKLVDRTFLINCDAKQVATKVVDKSNNLTITPIVGVVCPAKSKNNLEVKLTSSVFTNDFPLKAAYNLHKQYYSCRDDSCTNRVCGDSIVDIPVEECEGTSADCQQCKYVCRYYRIKPAKVVKAGQRIIDPKVAQDLTCLRTLLGARVDKTTYASQGARYKEDDALRDDAMVYQLLALALKGHPDFINDSVAQANLSTIAKTGGSTFKNGAGQTISLVTGQYNNANTFKGNVYFDDNCQAHYSPTLNDKQICGEFGVNYFPTPISLIFSKNNKLNKDWKLVNFEFEPGKEDWMIWKASEEAPLLVYNPKQEAIVANGTNLFGSWTFGGDKNSMLKLITSDKSRNNQARAWDNGYQPLSMLDRNQNNILEDQELNVISLWFDRNQNGVIDQGELESPANSGLKKIYTKPDTFNETSQEWSAALGFERVVDGELIKGSSVDWTTRTYSSQHEALTDLRINPTHRVDRKSENINTEKALASNNNFSGVWTWRLADNKQIMGVLYLGEEQGKIFGTSVVEEYMDSKRSGGVRSILQYHKLDGQVKHDQKSAQIETTTTDNIVTVSEVKLTSEGKLTGTSRAFVKGGSAGDEANVEYTWQAEKIGE